MSHDIFNFTDHFSGKTVEITENEFSVGRGLKNHYVLTNLVASRVHFILYKEQDKYYLIDKSSNGTLLNGLAIKGDRAGPLKDGDLLEIPTTDLKFTFNVLPDFDDSISDDLLSTAIDDLINESSPLKRRSSESAGLDEDALKRLCVSSDSEPSNPDKKEKLNKHLVEMEDEVLCAICSEMIIKAVSLNCSHTFCRYCINEWRKRKQICPICRVKIKDVTPTLMLDNLIEKMINGADEMTKKHRLDVLNERQVVENNDQPSTSRDSNGRHGSTEQRFSRVDDVISISSDSDDSVRSCSDYMGDYDFHFTIHHKYYGGYGRCYICHRRDHWANSCPFK